MKNLPKKIYLQIDADRETPDDFKELSGITWSTDKINKNDVEYVLPQSIINGSLILTIEKASKMIMNCSKETWTAVKGNENGWKEWWKKRNIVQVNGDNV